MKENKMVRRMALQMAVRRQPLWIAFSVLLVVLCILSRTIHRGLVLHHGPDSTSSRRTSSRMKVNFVFLIGLEGTGHHMYSSLMMMSPGEERLRQTGIYPKYIRRLQRLLYSQKKSRYAALWSAPCHFPEETKPLAEGNTTEVQEKLVDVMLEIADRVASFSNTTSQTIPLNGRGGGDDYGLLSYPGFDSACRPLQYPNLDVWYQVCERAHQQNPHIDCQHIYIYRDPQEVIKSTTINRKFNRNVLEAMHLYSTLLSVILYQLQKHPERLAACWDFRQPHNKDVARLWWGYDNLYEVPAGKNKTNYQDYEAAVESMYHAPKAEEDSIIPPDVKGYMDSLVGVHEAVVETCNQILHDKKEVTS